MPPKAREGQYDDDDKYDDTKNQRQTPRRLYCRYFRRRHGQIRGENEVMGDYRK